MKRSVYKRTARSGAHKGKKERRWTIAYELADGSVRTERAFTDRQASEQLLAQREREVAHGVVGLADPFAPSKSKPIADYVGRYLAAMKAEGTSALWIARTKSRLSRAIESMKVRTVAELSMESVGDYVAREVADRHLSLATRNHIVATLRAFATWLVDHGHLPRNPLAKLRQVPVKDGDRSEVSRVLTTDELLRLVEAAPLSRRLLYLFTAYTGFRRGEDAATTWSDLFVDGEHPHVRIRGANAKNGETVNVPVPTWLAAKLRQHRAEATMRAGGTLKPSEPVFHVPAGIVRQLRRDAAKAGLGTIEKKRHKTKAGNRWVTVEWIDPSGPNVTLKLHGLRAFFATALFEAGVPPHDVKKLCRHSSIATTIKQYTAWRQGRERAAVDALPNPFDVAVPVAVPAPVAEVPNVAAAVRGRPETPPAQGGQTLAK